MRDDQRHPMTAMGELPPVLFSRAVMSTGALRSENWFQRLVEHSADVIVLLDAGGLVLYASPAIHRLFGHTVEAVLGRVAFEFVHPEDVSYCRATLLDLVIHPDTVRRFEFRVLHGNGSCLNVEASGVSRLEDEAIAAVVVTFRDITERIRMETELRQSQEMLRRNEAQYRALVEQAADAILVADSAGRLIDANQLACELTGYSHAQLMQLSIADTYPPEDREMARDRLHSIGVGETSRSERRVRRFDGTDVAVEISLKRLEDGRVQGILRDITARKQVEDRLRWLTLATEQSPASVIMTDGAGLIQYVNPGFTVMSGYQLEEVLGKSPRILNSGLNDPAVSQRLWAAVKSGQVWRGELCNRKKSGELYWHSSSIAPIKDPDGHIINFVAVQQDITDRIEAEVALREQDARCRRLVESNILGIGFWDSSGAVSEANDEYLRITGYTREDLAAGTVNFRAMNPPEYESATTVAIMAAENGETVPPWEKELLRKDGARTPVVVGIAPLSERRDQGVVFLLDISQRRALEGQLRQAQKMEAVGRLAGGVAHDFNNILTAITGYCDLLREDLSPGHPGIDDVVEIRLAADRAAGLTRQLLAFSRQQVLEPRVLDLGELVHNLDRMLRRLLGEDVDLVTHVNPALGAVKADPGQVEQVLMNLAVNGRDAMPEGGKLVIDVRNAGIDSAFAASHAGMRPGAYVLLSVRDSGTGMNEATKARLFEPFFTTKDKGKGTGLGLSTVYGIVKQSEGFIDVQSELGRGSTFTVYLPRVEEAVESSSTDAPPDGVACGTETILLAEDDATVRGIVSSVLTRAGYRVLTAKSGAEALLIAAEYPRPIHMLVTDVVMPGLGGRDLAMRLLLARPGLRVLYMSGYTDDEVLRRGIVERTSAYLRKPFSPDLLLRKVRAEADRVP
ncbi:MAG: PAS domain S-box protein [Gemmatimonadota bacterium]